MLKFTIFQEDDLAEILQLFYETVHSVNAKDYSQEQLNAWAPLEEQSFKITAWQKSLKNNRTYVARIHHQIVGFGDITTDGYLDRLYVHKDFQGQGIASALVDLLEAEAKKLGLSHIYTDASLTARPFFERKGYQCKQTQTVERLGITLMNVQMIKSLTGVRTNDGSL
ncbi:GNAT family N-acetyltransferase [Lysinibacillus cavernae]|uniref:GNAT family N-acetyltransferase n=1 Tax=Lysinibacillus cavernae TaxID=2666135 RepID=UPI0012D8B895|nr:GNAT family N-acetyltransferase [Lysinibacillus cavernae]